MSEELKALLESDHAEGAIILTGFNDCVIGLGTSCGGEARLVYDATKMIEKIAEEDARSNVYADEGKSGAYERAIEHFEFNIIGGHYGPQGPIFVHPLEGST